MRRRRCGPGVNHGLTSLDANAATSVDAFYMTAGTVMPITARVRINSRRTTATVVSKKLPALLVRLAENRMPMIERIEKLRQLKYVLRQVCRLRRRNALVNHFRRFGRGDPQFPELVAAVAAQKCSQIGGRRTAGR